jgi:hypothetical protein
MIIGDDESRRSFADVVDLDFTEYARRRMRQRMVPDDAVYDIVGDAERVIHRRDGRTEYFGLWQGRPLMVVAEGDIEEDETLLVLNVIEDVRRRR